MTNGAASHYRKSIDVAAKPHTAYVAITQEMDRWWSTHVEGSIEAHHVCVSFPPNNGHWCFETTQLIPGELVEAKCVDAHHVVSGQPREIEQEWLNTRLRWLISPHNGGARIHFEHEGLVPALLCYGICEEGWDFFFQQSLASYLNNGVGHPHGAT